MLCLEAGVSVTVLTRFQEFMEYEDVLFHLLRALKTILKTEEKVDEKFLKNLVHLLEHITLHKTALKTDEKPKNFCCGMRESCIIHYHEL